MLRGEIPLELLSSKPTASQMFGDITAASGVPTPMSPKPAPPTPVPPSTDSKYEMTEKAGGFTREQYIDQGWTDEKLISEGMMLPPNGIKPSFG